MTDELEKHVHKKFEIMAKLGKGVRATSSTGNRLPAGALRNLAPTSCARAASRRTWPDSCPRRTHPLLACRPTASCGGR